MHIPTEILLAIIEGLADDRPTLLRLILVSRRFNALALPPLYETISFLVYSIYFEKQLAAVECLCRDIETNPGVRFTTAFFFEYKSFSKPREEAISQAHLLITRILPHLPNLRNLLVDFISTHAVDPAILRLLPSTARLTHLYLDCGRYSKASFLQNIVLLPTLEDIGVPEFYPRGAETQAIKLSHKELPNLRSLTLSVENSLLFDNLHSLDSLIITSDRISSFVEPEFAFRHLSEAFASIRILVLHCAGTNTLASLLSSVLNLQYISILDAPSSPSQAHDLGVILSKATNIELKGIQFGYSKDYDIAPFAQTLFGPMKHLVVIIWKSGDSVWRLDRGSKTAIPTPIQDNYKNQWEPMLQAVEDYVRRNTHRRRQ